ncbi:hypothetical protein JQ631_22510 [Bradyrhizobium manausense]|uniref:phage antirepressor N-terminal domain-containing protein n=1 Tax=Bradyrhizobium manausense TaxID=989370 RepID=UPI001BAABBC8|nr:phage antirepressor N-terminal domain-containing protein [Bradyrhizobium manausense]MBR0791863.1 hypothetical protein [Bradyrhizobium manausense]
MNRLVAVQFHGTELVGFQSGETVLIALKPIVTAMGLNWSGQEQRVKRDPVLREGICMMHMPSNGGAQRTLAIRLELLNGWLFRIDSGRIRDARIRELVQLYQRECYSVLYSHFSGERDKIKRQENESDSLSLRLVTECRHIWGNRSAAELWEKRGLPKVASMDAAFRQYDLFETSTLVPGAAAA